MCTERHSLTRTGVRFLLALLGAMTVWVALLEPGYDRLIAATGAFVLRQLESPRITATVRAEGSTTIVSHTAAFAALPEQRLELRTHHNNAVLLIALIVATPGLTHRRREQTLLLGMALLALTHVLHFILEVQWAYAVQNVGPLRVTDLAYLNRGFWQSLDNPAQAGKLALDALRQFYTHVGRMLAPIVLWLIVCRRALAFLVQPR